MKSIRKIIEIDEELCNGCGQCIPGCMEGAIAIIDGKAKLVKDSYCDGLGACLGHCPTGALTIIEREADGFDEAAALAYMAAQNNNAPSNHHIQAQVNGAKPLGYGGCPGAAIMGLRGDKSSQSTQPDGLKPFGMSGASAANAFSLGSTGAHGAHGAHGSLGTGPSHWPLKMRLVPVNAPFLQGADILVAADCAAAASPAFHSKYAPGKVLLIGCPKFDNTDDYLPKLTEMFKKSGIKSCTVLRMEVPCCRGFSLVVDEAARLSAKLPGSQVPVKHIILSRTGEELE